MIGTGSVVAEAAGAGSKEPIPRQTKRVRNFLILSAFMRPPSKQIKRGVRRTRHLSGWIVQPGLDDQECRVMDISINGAKIISAMPAQVPDRFELAFTQGDDKRRRCEVVWRRGKAIGVQFE